MAQLISEQLVASGAPKIYGYADYTWSGTTLSVTAYMRTGSAGGWANDPWCAWITVDGTTQTVQTKGRTSGTVGTTWRGATANFTVSGASKTVSVKFSSFNNGSGTATHTGTAYSPVSAPTYNSINASNITSSSARLTASINENGGSLTDGGWDVSTDGGATWSYYSGGPTDKTITGLTRYTTYWFRGYAVNAGGGNNSNWSSFTTLPVTPSISGVSISNITPTSANASFSVTDNGGPNIVDYYIGCFTDAACTAKVGTIGSSGTFTGLTPHKTYYVRANASNGTYRGYSAVGSFTTTFNNPGQPGTITLSYDTPELVKRTKVTVKWTASSAGSTAVSGYRFQVYKNGSQVSSVDTDSTAVSKTITLSDYSFKVGDKLLIRIYAYSKCSAGDKHFSSLRDSSTVTVISDRYVWVSINGAAYVRRKLYISSNGGAYVWIKREKFKVSTNGSTLTLPIK